MRIMNSIMKRMIKRMALMAVATMTVIGTWAAPALPGAFQVKQADGTMLTIELKGDEYFHWTSTTDGTLLVERAGGYYVAAISDRGVLTATNVLAHDPLQRTAAEQEAICHQKARRHLWEAQAQQSRRAAAISTTGSYVPHNGSPKILVILAEYQDLAFSINDPVAAFNQYMNGEEQVDMGNHNNENYCSVRKYFEASSHGAFTPQFDVVGPVTLPETMAYYGGGDSNSERMRDLGKDAIELVKDQVNMYDYDNDGDGKVELVFIIFAGIGQNQGGPQDNMWAKVSTQNLQVYDNLKATRIGCSSELFHPQRPDWINGIGVFTHEFSHALGLPDLYPTNTAGRKVNNQGMEYWDVMDNGLYVANGYQPSLYTAWDQEAAGWIEIEPLTEAAQGLSMLPLSEGGTAYKFCNQDNDCEFIVMENIQKRGLSSKAIYHGMIVYHVAYPYSVVNMGDSPNNTPGKPSVAIVPADGIMISSYQRDTYYDQYGGSYTTAEYKESLYGDPFPGKTEVTQVADYMELPNFVFYGTDGNKPVGMALLNIREDEQTGAIFFDVVDGTTAGIHEELSMKREDSFASSVYDLQGRRIDGSRFNVQGSQLAKGIYIVKGKKVVR